MKGFYYHLGQAFKGLFLITLWISRCDQLKAWQLLQSPSLATTHFVVFVDVKGAVAAEEEQSPTDE